MSDMCSAQDGDHCFHRCDWPSFRANLTSLLPVSTINDTKSAHQLRELLSNQKSVNQGSPQELKRAYLTLCTDSLAYYGSVCQPTVSIPFCSFAVREAKQLICVT